MSYEKEEIERIIKSFTDLGVARELAIKCAKIAIQNRYEGGSLFNDEIKDIKKLEEIVNAL